METSKKNTQDIIQNDRTVFSFGISGRTFLKQPCPPTIFRKLVGQLWKLANNKCQEYWGNEIIAWQSVLRTKIQDTYNTVQPVDTAEIKGWPYRNIFEIL